MKNRVFRSQSGQAALEYILLLFVIVSIGMGILYQFNSAFRAFATNYFGSYLACLLETGELPSLGSTEGSGGECDSEFKPFDLADGRPLRESSVGGGTSGGGAQSTPNAVINPPGNNVTQTNPTVQAARPAVVPESSSGKGEPPLDGSGGGGDVGSAGAAPIRSARSSGGGDSTAAGGGAGAGKPVALNSTEQAELAKTRISEEAEGRLRYLPSDRSSSEDTESLRQRNIAASEGDLQAGGRRVPADFNAKKKGKDSEADVGLSFPDFLRYLIIAAIIIAIVFFFGGQALQFSKSQEKS